MKKKYLISFDARNDHERIIKDLVAKGWHSVTPGFNSNGEQVICYLPNTTWYKEFTSAKLANEEMMSVVGTVNMLRFTTTVFEDWYCSTTSPMPHQIEEAKKMGLKKAA